MFKSNPANTSLSFCVPHELPVQIWVVTIVKPPSPSRIIWAAFRLSGEYLLMGEPKGGELAIERRLFKSHRQLPMNGME